MMGHGTLLIEDTNITPQPCTKKDMEIYLAIALCLVIQTKLIMIKPVCLYVSWTFFRW